MPFYEYKCEDCDYHFTTYQNINDETLKYCGIHCPIQDIGRVKKLISKVNFIVKNGEFYDDDYKRR